MHTSDFTSFASPLDDFFQRYLPREHEKTLRNSFIQAVALVTVGGIFFGLYYVYNILEPFCVPLLWALLSGIVLHPYKRTITKTVKFAVDNVIKNDQTIAVALGLSLMGSVDNVADLIGTYFTKKWKMIVVASFSLPMLQMFTYLFPDALSWTLELFQNILMVDLTDTCALNNVQLHHVISSLLIFLVSAMFCGEEYSFLCQTASMVTWVLGAAYLSNFLWSPLVYLMTLLWVYGYCTEPAEQDEHDGSPSLRQENTRIKSVLLSFLSRLGLLGSDEPDTAFEADRRASDPTTSTPVVRDLSPRTDRPTDSPVPSKVHMEAGAEGPKLLHPGVSKLQKQHGIVRPNISGIVSVGGNTPKSRVLGRSYVYRLKRRSSLHSLGNDSWTYIRWALWSCLLLQLWVRPWLAHLLPAPIGYYLVKRIANYTGATRLLHTRAAILRDVVRDLLESRHHLIFPPCLMFILKVSYSVERKLLKALSRYLDVIVTMIMILTMMVGITIAGIFISFQVYAESVYIVQSLGSITTTLNMTDSYIFVKLNTSMAGMENVVEGAFNYGRDWISRTLHDTLAEADGTARTDLEGKILELWDRSYQYWVTDQRNTANTRPEEGESVGELLTQLYTSSNLFNIAALQTFVQNNMGTLTSILEQVWSLTKGNVGFFFETGIGMLRVILNGGSGVVNFFFSIFVYLTALFYLLSNSSDAYIPMEVISQYSIFQISGVGATIQKAINSVFLITIKMSCFYLLWTYITHIVFGASIVFVPIIFR